MSQWSLKNFEDKSIIVYNIFFKMLCKMADI